MKVRKRKIERAKKERWEKGNKENERGGEEKSEEERRDYKEKEDVRSGPILRRRVNKLEGEGEDRIEGENKARYYDETETGRKKGERREKKGES